MFARHSVCCSIITLLFAGLFGLVSVPAAVAQEAEAADAAREADLAEVMRLIPARAHVVLIIPNAKRLNDNVAKFAKAAAIPVDDFDNVVGEIQDETGLKDGVDLDGPFAMVVPMVRFGGEPGGYIMVRVSDEDAFDKNFDNGLADVEGTDGVQHGEIGWTEFYVRRHEKWAILSNKAGTAQKWQPSPAQADRQAPAEGEAADNGERAVQHFHQRIGERGVATIADSDIALAVNMGELGPLLKGMMTMGLMTARQQLAAQPPSDLEMVGGAEGARAFLDLGNDLAGSILTESEGIVGGLKIDGEMMSGRAALRFKPDAKIHRFLGEATGKADSLEGLPAGKVLAALAYDGSMVKTDAVIEAINQRLQGKIPNDAAAKEMLDAYLAAFAEGSVPSRLAYYLNEGDDADSQPFHVAGLYETDQPAQFIEKVGRTSERMIESARAMVEVTAPGDVAQAPTLEIEDQAMRIGDVPVTRMRFDMALDEDVEAPALWRSMMEQTSYLAPLDGKVAMVQAPDASMLEKMIAGEADAPLIESAARQALDARLPGDRILSGYVDLTAGSILMTNMVEAMMPFGDPPPPRKPVTGKPAGFALGWGDHELTTGFAVPAEAVKTMVEAVEERQQQGRNVARAQAQAAQARAQVQIQGARIRVQGNQRIIVRNGRVIEEAADATEAAAPEKLVTVTDDDFQAKVAGSEYPVVVLFTADWSATGKKQVAVLETLLADEDLAGEVAFATVDIDSAEAETTVADHKVTALPTMVIYRDGKAVKTIEGQTNAEDLKAAIEAARK